MSLRTSSIDSRFTAMAQRVESIDLILDPRNPQSLKQADNDLGKVIEELEQLQSIGQRGTPVGPDDVYGPLTGDISELLQQTRLLRDQIKKSIPSTLLYESNKRDDKEPEPPLTREEIAKLLLVVSRAFSIALITIEQRSFIKDEICKRKVYLRGVLQSEDIFAVMKSLAELSPA